MVTVSTLFQTDLKIIFLLARKFPLPHILVITENGTVLDVSIHENTSPSKGQLIKLPKLKKYFGYSDPKGVLYFIDGNLQKPVTTFHSSFGHKTIKMNQVSATETACGGLYFRGNFWLYEFSKQSQISFDPSSFLACISGFVLPYTYSWQHEKQYLIDGPNIKSELHGIEGQFCSTSINFTHIFVAFYAESENLEENFFILDYEKGLWTTLPKNPNQNFVMFCQCIITMNKRFEKMLYLFRANFVEELDIVDRFDLMSATWEQIFSSPNPNLKYLGTYLKV